MSFFLRVVEASPSLYEPDDTTSYGWMGFVFAQAQQVGPSYGYFHIADLWTLNVAPSGFLVFAPRRPANPATFVTRFWAAPFAKQNPSLGLPAWVPNPDDEQLIVSGIDMAFGAMGVQTTGSGSVLAFGGSFSFSIPSGGAVKPGTDDTLTIQGVQPGFGLAMANGSSMYGFENWLTLPLSGPSRGQIQLTATSGIDPSAGAADLAQHFFYPVAGGTTLDTSLAVLRYPLFDVGPTGPKLSFDVSLDPADPFNPDRTSFAFQSGAPALTSGFTTAMGQQVNLTPLAGSSLVFQPLPTQLTNGVPTGPGGAPVGSCLTACGQFQVSLTPATPDGSARILGGLSGAEYNVAASAPPIMEFVVGQPALALTDPTTASASSIVGLDDGGGLAVTAWTQLVSPAKAQTLEYCSQPQQSPFYAASGGSTNWLFGYAETPMWSGNGPTPLMPSVGYGLTSSQSDFVQYTAMDQHVLAPARWQAALDAQSETVQPPAVMVTGGGLLVTQAQGALPSVVIASTVDNAGTTHTFELANASPKLMAALQASQVFLVASRPTDANGNSLFTVNGDVAITDWSFSLDYTTTQAQPILIMKFGSASIATLAGQIGAWTEGQTFNEDPTAIQTLLASMIATATTNAASSDPELSAMYTAVAQAFNDPNWNGVLVLNPVLPGLPAVVQGVASGLPVGQALIGNHVGVRVNDLGQDAHGNPSITRSAVFALVDYEAPAATNASSSSLPYAFQVNYLRALFENAQLRIFDCQIELVINELFGVPAVLRAGNADAPSNAVTIQGTYQAKPSASGSADQQGSYAFVSLAPVEFRLAYERMTTFVTNPVITIALFEKIQYAPYSTGTQQQRTAKGSVASQAVASRFAFWGWFAFGPPLPVQGKSGPDLFDYDQLSFGNLGLIMRSHTPPVTGDPTWSLDTSHISFDLSSSQLRPGLANDLPVSLVALVADDSGSLTPSSFGCMPLALSANAPQQVSSANYALVYRLDLGGAGAMAPLTQNLIATIVVAWQPGGGMFAGIGIPGLGPQSLLPLQGVMPITIGGFGIAQDANGRLILQMTNCTASFLGGAVPPSPLAFTLNAVGVPQGANNTLIWFGEAVPTPASPKQLTTTAS